MGPGTPSRRQPIIFTARDNVSKAFFMSKDCKYLGRPGRILCSHIFIKGMDAVVVPRPGRPPCAPELRMLWLSHTVVIFRRMILTHNLRIVFMRASGRISSERVPPAFFGIATSHIHFHSPGISLLVKRLSSEAKAACLKASGRAFIIS